MVRPNLRKWRIFERDDFTSRGEQRREELARYLESLERHLIRFEEQRDRRLARDVHRHEAKAG